MMYLPGIVIAGAMWQWGPAAGVVFLLALGVFVVWMQMPLREASEVMFWFSASVVLFWAGYTLMGAF